MKRKFKPTGKEIFRNVDAIRFFDKMVQNSNIYEYGIDGGGRIYFAWLNGNIERYTRRQFLTLVQQAKEYELTENW